MPPGQSLPAELALSRGTVDRVTHHRTDREWLDAALGQGHGSRLWRLFAHSPSLKTAKAKSGARVAFRLLRADIPHAKSWYVSAYLHQHSCRCW